MHAIRSTAATAAPLPICTHASAFNADWVQGELRGTRRKLAAGQPLYRAGQPLRAVYVVHVGCIKSSLASSDGRERVTGFHLRGDLLGLDSIGMPMHAGDAFALEDSEIWEIVLADLMAGAARNPELQAALTASMSAQLRCERQWMLSVGTLPAEQRVATLLLDLGLRLQALGFSATHFVLRMTRADIGSFLNLQLETVTRAMTTLRERGLIDVSRREIRILDSSALRALVGTTH